MHSGALPRLSSRVQSSERHHAHSCPYLGSPTAPPLTLSTPTCSRRASFPRFAGGETAPVSYISCGLTAALTFAYLVSPTNPRTLLTHLSQKVGCPPLQLPPTRPLTHTTHTTQYHPMSTPSNKTAHSLAHEVRAGVAHCCCVLPQLDLS